MPIASLCTYIYIYRYIYIYIILIDTVFFALDAAELLLTRRRPTIFLCVPKAGDRITFEPQVKEGSLYH